VAAALIDASATSLGGPAGEKQLLAVREVAVYGAARHRELPMPPERLIPTLHALNDGLTLLRALMPELVTDAVIIAAFDALAGARE
jgi:hypothetical protein